MMRRLLAVLTIAGLAASCAVGPNYKRPEITSPDRFYGEAQAAQAKALTDVPWFEVFGDPELKALVEQALANGYDARIAAARVEEAQARYGVAKSAYWPQVGYAAGYDYTRLPQSVDPSGNAASRYSANVNVAWEIDLWGRVRRLNEAALHDYLATEEARRGVLLTLASEVAQSYFALIELDAELEIAKRTTSSFQETFDLFNRKLQGGAASALETSRAQALTSQTAAAIPDIERRIVETENQINLLVGRPPQPIPRGTPLQGQRVYPEAPPGLPSALLERRPDVRQAEETLISANAGVGVAQANFFPVISLTGLLGGVSKELSEVFGNDKTWSIGAGLAGPIFQGGRLKREKQVAIAQWEQAKIGYEQAVTNAFADVSTALVAVQKLQEVKTQLASSVAAYEESVRIANVRYLSGLSSYFEVIDAQQQLFPVENALAQARRDELNAIVSLYKALGGGWQPQEPGAANSDRKEAP
ncbi:MAG TPA: efflux transporter outer membrane subunit [Candidatus Polarisedimenticolaceae bacterium]|nr:efflux transporter outer membrane subunit [Candidatus Polarisedimenticolaceae bacterium]